MRKNLRFVSAMAAAMLLLYAACSPSSPTTQAEPQPQELKNDSLQSEQCEALTDSLVRQLFWSLPTFAEESDDITRSEKVSASAAAALIKEAKDLVTLESPLRTAYYASSIFGEICDREKTSIDSIRIFERADSTVAVVYVRYCYIGYSGSREYSYIATTLNLVQSAGHWLIDDFAIGKGHFKSEVTEFIRRQRICFLSQEWRNWFVQERFEGKYPRYKEKDKPTSKRMLTAIDEYLRQYPDNVSVVGSLSDNLQIESSPEISRKLKASGLNDARVRALFNAIPGATSRHKSCNLPDVTKAYSKQLSALMGHAFDVPNDAFGNEGSRNQLNYLVNSQEDDLVFVFATNIIPVNEDFVSAYLTVAHIQGFNVDLREHNIQLVRENNQWLIADFGRSQMLMEYIARQRRFFRSNEWQQRVAQERKLAATEEDKHIRAQWQESIEKNLNDVDAYFAKYPDK